MLKSLTYYWRSNLLLMLACAVAAAVLTGALLVGDSVKGSLRDLALDRLGRIDAAVVSHRLFDQDLARRLSSISASEGETAQPNGVTVAPALLVNGSALAPPSGRRAARISISGIESTFEGFFSQEWDWILPEGTLFPPAVINQALARELAVEVGSELLFSFRKVSDIHPETLLGRRSADQVVAQMRVSVSQILPDQGIGGFGLRPSQQLTFNAFVPLANLQQVLGRERGANALLVSDSFSVTDSSPDLSSALQDRLGRAVELEDYGLLLKPQEGFWTLESREFVLDPALTAQALTVASQLELRTQPVLTYLANEIRSIDGSVPYSTVSAIDAGGTTDSPFGDWILRDGRPAPPLKDGEVYLNQWAARRLSPRLGQSIRLSFYTLGDGEELTTETAELTFAGTLRIQGLAADRSLTADYPGIAEHDNMADWDPPFPVDLSRVKREDEDYWDRYRATPKAFVGLQQGQRLWTSRFGDLTAIRLAPGSQGGDPAGLQDDFRRKLVETLRPTEYGFSVQAVKKNALAAASGSTDFGMLFLSFSFFLIISASLIVGLLFRLSAEVRVREIGLLMALGFTPSKVKHRMLSEGLLIAVPGVALGLAGAVGYAGLMMQGLRTLWVEAVGSPFLFLHIDRGSLLIGAAVSLLVVGVTLFLALRKMTRASAPSLLAGEVPQASARKPSRWARLMAYGGVVAALSLSLATLWVPARTASLLFFGVGASLLTAGLAFFSLWCRGQRKGRVIGAEGNGKILLPMTSRSVTRNAGRSLLSAALTGIACFLIVAVGAFHEDPSSLENEKESGTGGFSLMARSDIPLHGDLNDSDVRFDLGFSDPNLEALADVRLYPMRLLPGDDASCLNLYQPEKPQILGVTADLIRRGGFSFGASIEERENPWELLEDTSQEDVIPAFADANSAQWILKVPLGGEIAVEDDRGRTLRLRLVGLLSTSVFQSELLISEKRFVESFPSRDGYSAFLIEAPAEESAQTAEILEKTLGDTGFDVVSTSEKLAGYYAVQNTYLSTFQTLGGLGLLLGTLGLGIIMVRSVIERRRELAVMRAFGFPRTQLTRFVMAENAFLLILGMGLGTVSAALAVAPHLLGRSASLPWVGLTLTLAVIFLVGLAAGSVAVRAAVKTPLIPALKEER